MGAAESTSRTNGTNQEEEERNQKSSTLVGAAATIAAVGVAAWGISRMLSDKKDTQENESAMKMKMIAEPSYVPEGKSRTSNVTWSPPSPGRLKMNTDGTCRPDNVYNKTYGPGGYGGILRDHNGKWVRGFIGYIDVTDSLTAELHGILKGLEFLDKRRYKEATLETDCQGAFQYIDKPYKECSDSQIIKDSWHIIAKCRQLVAKNKIKISLVGEGANKCADKLADFARENKAKIWKSLILRITTRQSAFMH
ncbi:polynucleotidyl transferase, ribonuclease H-like superfamily protein 1 [Artemisia annua]|uniref:Polynucleotidyl transferase, ribonuclease H-like superfamily protein 1 n=1 Tax=Artemisia annua TaxID=35608 RepID=A0A2U1P6I6_ARTAN|nr:polynucleotidyl transferase, ribonuclease H-like superfamily protein 1 [Artemisia annua]